MGNGIVVIFFGVLALFGFIVYVMREKIAMSDIKEILTAIITSADTLITGEKMGATRMNEVVKIAETVLNSKQMQIVEKKGGLVKVAQGIFDVLKPLLKIASAGILCRK